MPRFVALFATILCLCSFVQSASAKSIDFVVDAANSSVTLFQFGNNDNCDLTSCSIAADLAPSLPPADFSLEAGQSASFDFLTLTGTGSGTTGMSVFALLAFTTPDNLDTLGGGGGFTVNFAGTIFNGQLTWTTGVPNLVTLGDGSQVLVDFEDANFGSLTGAASIAIQATVSVVSVAAIPLPAGLPLLLAGLGAFTLARRRRTA